MEETFNLKLPYIMPSQAQKHVTHNEALRSLDALVQLSALANDLADAPALPAEGDRYLVAAGGVGAWSGKDGQIAAWQDGGWAFFPPRTGWRAWLDVQKALLVWDGAAWIEVGDVNPTAFVGVNTIADATNRLAVKSDAVLFSHDDVTPGSGDSRAILNKAGTVNNASLVFQNAWTGRAEFGLTGDDKFRIKVSADGSAWSDAMTIDQGSAYVGIGTTAPSRPLTIDTRSYPGLTTGDSGLLVVGDGNAVRAEFRSAASAPSAAFQGFGAQGSHDSPSATLDGNRLFAILGSGFDGSSFVVPLAAQIDFRAKDAWSATSHGSYITFTTTPSGSTTLARAERLRITDEGNIGIGTSSPSCRLHVSGAIRPAAHTVATVPSASAMGAGAMIFVSDESGGGVPAFSDGTDWRRVTDRAVVS